jgi:hypothetical protein
MARVHGGAKFDLRSEIAFALGCAGLSFDGRGATLMAEVPYLMTEVPHLLSVPNGFLADWDETKKGRSMRTKDRQETARRCSVGKTA